MMKHGGREVAHLTEDIESKYINMCKATFITNEEEWLLDSGPPHRKQNISGRVRILLPQRLLD